MFVLAGRDRCSGRRTCPSLIHFVNYDGSHKEWSAAMKRTANNLLIFTKIAASIAYNYLGLGDNMSQIFTLDK